MLDFVLYAVMTQLFNVHYQVANALSVAASLLNGFLWKYYVNFKVKDRFVLRLASFYGVGMFGWFLAAAQLWLFVDILSMNALCSKLVAIVVCTVVQFVLNKHVTFGRRSKKVKVEPLAWDSGFFGMQVGSVDVDGVDAESLDAALRNADFDLVYINDASGLCDIKNVIARNHGVRVDRKIIMSRTVRADDVRIGGCCAASRLNDRLKELACSSGWLSRFNMDKRLRRFFRPMYETWLENDFQHGKVFVWPDEDGAVGLATVQMKGGEGKIGLVAVAESARRQGVGMKLMEAVLSWIASQDGASCTVATQGENLGARRLYEKAGFKIVSEHDVYHLWREE